MNSLTNDEALALYADHEAEIKPIWESLDEAATMRDAVEAWIKGNEICEAAKAHIVTPSFWRMTCRNCDGSGTRPSAVEGMSPYRCPVCGGSGLLQDERRAGLRNTMMNQRANDEALTNMLCIVTLHDRIANLETAMKANTQRIAELEKAIRDCGYDVDAMVAASKRLVVLEQQVAQITDPLGH